MLQSQNIIIAISLQVSGTGLVIGCILTGISFYMKVNIITKTAYYSYYISQELFDEKN